MHNFTLNQNWKFVRVTLDPLNKTRTQWVCQPTFNQKLGFSTHHTIYMGGRKKVHPLCAAVLTVQLSTDFGASDSLSRKFDAIWANPPFHEGFSTSKKILIRFLESSSKLLKRNGAALFVVNNFIPIERIASSYFHKIKVLDKNKSYKIVMLTN